MCNKYVNSYLLPKYSGFTASNLSPSSNNLPLNSRLIIKPLFIYENPLDNGNIIKKDIYGFSGIYLWYNNNNGKCYIGSGANLYRRISNYYQVVHLKRSYPIIAAINK